MENAKITITLKNGSVNVKTSRSIPFIEFLQIMQTAILSSMKSLYEAATNHESEEHHDAIKRGIYDDYNIAASNTLESFAPEFELRPDLTEEAILEAENKIINEGRAPALKVDPKKLN